MKKFINIFLAVLITLFSFPIGNVNVSAAEKVYDDIADGEYDLTAKLLKEGSDEASAAASFMSEEVLLSIKDGEKQITFFIPKNDMMKFSMFEVEGHRLTEPSATDETTMKYTFELNELKELLASQVTYEVPSIGLVHENVGMDIKLIGLETLPKVVEEEPEEEQPEETEKPEPELSPEERVVGELISEADADEVYTVNFDSDSRATKGQLENPTKLLVKGDKEYIQIPVNEGGAQYFRSLKFNGEEVIWNSITEGPYTIQYELVDGIEGNIDVSMVIQAGPNAMPHDGIKLWFDKDSLELVKEAEDIIEEPQEDPKEEPKDKEDPNEEPKEEAILTPDKAYEINYTILNENGKTASVADGFFVKPGKLLEKDGKTYFQLTVESAEMVQALSNEYGDYILVNEKDGTKTMQLQVPNDLSDMKLDMHIVVPAGAIPGFPGYDSEHGAVLTFDKNSKKSISVEDVELVASGDKKNGNGPFVEGTEPVTPTPSPTPKPTPVNPTPEPTPEPKPGKGKVNLTPDKAYEINYTILQENGKDVSVADDFFVKPGKLLVKDGKTYFQMTVGSADMVKSLSNKYGDYIIVSKNKDGSMTMQIRVPNDLSDIELDMHIVVPAGAVPGFPGYDSEHGAILTFDLASKKEISVEGLKVVASGDKDNENGPYVEGATPGKPAFGDNGNENGDKKFGKNGNPKTGDTSQIFFFASLLMASLGVLVLQLRRRLSA